MTAPMKLPKGAAWAIFLILVLATAGVPVLAVPDGSAGSSAGSSRRVLGYYVTYDPASWSRCRHRPTT